MTSSSMLQNDLLLLIIVLGLLAIVRFEAFCLSDLAHTPDNRLRTLDRQGWLVFILFFIPLGGFFYLLYGRPR